MSRERTDTGFTLVEILIALLIIAVGLGAAVRATTQGTSSAEEMKRRTLALWIAQDRLAGHLVRRSWPAPGSASGAVAQANIPFAWRETVVAAPNPVFRNMTIEVYAAAQPEHVLVRLVGYLPEPAPGP